MIHRGYIEPFWKISDVENLDFSTNENPYIGFDLINELDRNLYSSQISSDRFIGIPDILISDIWEKEFSWLDKKIYAVHRMIPGTLLPYHRDLYNYYRKNHGVDDLNKIIRIILFLDHRREGHIIEIENKPMIDWKAGEWVSWRGRDAHLAANLGNENRYTFQITGILKDDS